MAAAGRTCRRRVRRGTRRRLRAGTGPGRTSTSRFALGRRGGILSIAAHAPKARGAGAGRRGAPRPRRRRRLQGSSHQSLGAQQRLPLACCSATSGRCSRSSAGAAGRRAAKRETRRTERCLLRHHTRTERDGLRQPRRPRQSRRGRRRRRVRSRRCGRLDGRALRCGAADGWLRAWIDFFAALGLVKRRKRALGAWEKVKKQREADSKNGVLKKEVSYQEKYAASKRYSKELSVKSD